MYTLSRVTHSPMARRYSNPWYAGEEFFRAFMGSAGVPMRTNVKQTDDAYLFEAELPGFENDEISLTVQDGVLTIDAAHKESAEDESSFSNRTIHRSFTLEGIDEESIDAEYKSGILRVTLPKAKAPDAPEARKIEVK